MENLHFCGGLPRTGSTVLMNILQQNPRIFTTGTCALADLISNHILIKSRFRESFQAMSTEQADAAMYGLVHGATKGWFEGLTNKPTVISKNRSWSNVFHLYEKSKYIVMVRDLRDIVESFEKVNSKISALHTFHDDGSFLPSMSENEKFQYHFQTRNCFSEPLNTEIPRMMEIFQKQKNKVMFIRYEDLTKEPVYILNKLYGFIEEKSFEHDLNNISQSILFEHDHAYFREKTDHVTKPKFEFYKTPQRTLSNNFHNRILKEFNWFYDAFYPDEI